MSYRQSFSKKITVHYSGSVGYPASQHGGRVSYSGTASEDVTVNVDVDTNPFDKSIDGCNRTVNLLTGAVVATEAAQIDAIYSNARKVGATIVDGFFKTIRSEISQQIMELSTKLDATLVHLRELAKRCAGKQQQMEKDYSRISSRYVKIFDDLNGELENRIFELNKPAFVFKRESDNQAIRISGSDLVSTVAVFGAEGGDLQAKISASIIKKRALSAIGKANTFLLKQKQLNATINQSMLKESVAAARYLPVCFIETQNEKSQIGKSMYQADFLSKIQANELAAGFEQQSWGRLSKDSAEKIGQYFHAEVSNCYASADAHTDRVKENIIRMLNFNSIKSI
ncbi:MAG: hypothetical protein LBK18_07685 [Prevotellaceae bacterium]|jgi:hypothetical protein|nr:hypothetical protein [Prevotellaceae bacterium]